MELALALFVRTQAPIDHAGSADRVRSERDEAGLQVREAEGFDDLRQKEAQAVIHRDRAGNRRVRWQARADSSVLAGRCNGAPARARAGVIDHRLLSWFVQVCLRCLCSLGRSTARLHGSAVVRGITCSSWYLIRQKVSWSWSG